METLKNMEKKNKENRKCLPIIARMGILCNVNRHQGDGRRGATSRSPSLNSVGAGKTVEF